MLKGALLGSGIAIVGLLIPIAHFVTGPFGPAIGGYIGGQSLEDPIEAKVLGLGLLMGLITAAISFIPIGVLLTLSIVDTVWLAVPLGIGVYVTGLGMVGAFFGTRSSRRSEV